MEAGNPLIDYSCPVCGKRFRSVPEHAGRPARCPDCSETFTIPSIVPAPGSRPPPRSRYTDRFGDEGLEAQAAGSSARPPDGGPTEPPRWPNHWAIIWGVALLFAVLMPTPVSSRKYSGNFPNESVESIHWVFAWDLIEKTSERDGAQTKLLVGLIATVGLGVFSVVAGGTMRGNALGQALFWASAGAFLLNFLLVRSWEVFGRIQNEAAGAVVVILLMLMATATVAAGNHVRKFRPHAPAPRLLAGIGGIVLVGGMLLPVFGGHMMLEGLLEEKPWDKAPALMACCVAFVIFALFSLSSFLSGAIRSINRTISVFIRLIMIGLPIVVVVSVMTEERDPNFGIVFITLMKVFLSLYAPLAILAVGLAAMSGAGGERDSRA